MFRKRDPRGRRDEMEVDKRSNDRSDERSFLLLVLLLPFLPSTSFSCRFPCLDAEPGFKFRFSLPRSPSLAVPDPGNKGDHEMLDTRTARQLTSDGRQEEGKRRERGMGRGCSRRRVDRRVRERVSRVSQKEGKKEVERPAEGEAGEKGGRGCGQSVHDGSHHV